MNLVVKTTWQLSAIASLCVAQNQSETFWRIWFIAVAWMSLYFANEIAVKTKDYFPSPKPQPQPTPKNDKH